MLPFPAVNFARIPWDFVLILIFFATVVPWRGAARISRLLHRPTLTGADRLSLYGSTIFFQWVILAIVAWRAASRGMNATELGLTIGEGWRTGVISVLLTGLLCAIQIAGLRKMAALPEERRSTLFVITEKIMPRSLPETWVYAGLACTAGVSEEFLYRGFLFAMFARILSHYAFSSALALLFSSLWFAVAHFYQGRRGMVTTFVVGAIFAAVRIWAGSLIPVIFAHIGVDLTVGLCVARISSKSQAD